MVFLRMPRGYSLCDISQGLPMLVSLQADLPLWSLEKIDEMFYTIPGMQEIPSYCARGTA